ncbi:MAG: hypothetical protein R3320_01990 [Nitriliruptorales bacterium]|nr:hypothetical protein [Nitriliruptorales bacterium]
MTTAPPRKVTELVRRGVRLLAAAVVGLTVVAITAAAHGGVVVPLVAGGAFLLVSLWMNRRTEQTSAVGTSAAVIGLALLAVGARALLDPTGETLELFLWITGGLFLVSGIATDERRLVSLGLLQWAFVLIQPAEGAAPFRHCMFATDLAIPVPRLDPLLLLGLGAAGAGSLSRFRGWRLEAGRGAEVTGLVLLEMTLLAKAAELPDLRVLCGPGGGVDVGWLLLAMAVGIAAGLYGLAGRDPVWTGVGGGGLALAGLMGTSLTGEAIWAALALLPLVGALALSERAGVAWPRRPGYGRRRPWEDR